jgi:hypothetical protein
MFDVDIERIKFQEGVLCLQQGSKQNRLCYTHFPNHLTANVEYKEAAFANNQCTLAIALLGPLAQQLLAGKTTKGFDLSLHSLTYSRS